MAALIAYYSRAGENYVDGFIKNLSVGNTETAAELIRRATGADIFKIEPSEEYSSNYKRCTEQAQADQRCDARPPLKRWLDGIDAYDTIYLGYPNYWSTMPMAVFSFLEHYDFSGKRILPFCTHEGSGLGGSVRDIKRLCPAANVSDGLAIRGSRAAAAENMIKEWITSIESKEK